MKKNIIINYKLQLLLLIIFFSLFTVSSNITSDVQANNNATETPTPDSSAKYTSSIQQINPYFSIGNFLSSDGKEISAYIINGPPVPPPGNRNETSAYIQQLPSNGILEQFPSYSWVFGCSAVSGAMIAGYYDRNGYPNIYTGPTNGGIMPISDTSWPVWYSSVDDPYDPYPSNPLIASQNGVDGRTILGSIDDYWISYGSEASDPYLIGGWEQHVWNNAIGDYMKTSQSEYGNIDGSTVFYNWTQSSEKLSCSRMEIEDIDNLDGTYGRKLFYEARGYVVSDCYNQKTDNNGGGFLLADFKAEIDAGHPVFLNLEGHSIVGFGYDGSTIFIRDTWDNDPNENYFMTWGGSYGGMELLSVSVVRLEESLPPITYDQINFLPLFINNQ